MHRYAPRKTRDIHQEMKSAHRKSHAIRPEWTGTSLEPESKHNCWTNGTITSYFQSSTRLGKVWQPHSMKSSSFGFVNVPVRRFSSRWLDPLVSVRFGVGLSVACSEGRVRPPGPWGGGLGERQHASAHARARACALVAAAMGGTVCFVQPQLRRLFGC